MSGNGLLLFAGAGLGHAALLIYSLNWFYGHALPHKLLGHIRTLHFLAGIAGLGVFWYVFGPDLRPALPLSPGGMGVTVLATYVKLCWLAGFVTAPGLTLARLLRKRPAVLASNHTRTVDVAAELGYRPLGRGRYRRLAGLPGNQVFQVDFAERTLRLPRLPTEWQGLSVLHVSDMHLNGTPDRDFFRYVMDRCREWEPDLVAVTGDVIDSERHHRWVLPLLGRLRWKIAGLAILGNHDSWYDPALVRRRLRRVGFRVLGNRSEQIEVRGRPMTVVGHEGPWFQPAPGLPAVAPGEFRFCLSHTPDNLPWARRHHIDLMVAGHVHGGQIRFPLVGSVLVPSRFSRRYDGGTFHEPPTVLHVSRGLGGQHPLRYLCRPEVAKLILQPAR